MSNSDQGPGGSSPPPPPFPSNPYGQNPYGGAPIAYGQQSPPSSTAATWSLVLAIAFFIPFATIVSIVLAIITLSKPNGGRDHGRGRAIAALVIDALLILAIVGIIAIAVGTGSFGDVERDADGQVTEAADISVFDLRVGDCFDDDAFDTDDDAPGEAQSVGVIPCDEPHELEAYFTDDLEDGRWPGLETVQTLTVDICRKSFKDFVGVGLQRSELGLFYVYPQEDSWKRLDDRAVLCAVGEVEDRVTGTLRNAKR